MNPNTAFLIMAAAGKMSKLLLHNFHFFALHNYRSHLVTELYCCAACHGHCNIFNRHWFQMLSGILHSTTFIWVSHFLPNCLLKTTVSVQEGWHTSWRWCSLWLWLLPLCFCHGSHVFFNAIDWLEYSSFHKKVSLHISQNTSICFVLFIGHLKLRSAKMDS